MNADKVEPNRMQTLETFITKAVKNRISRNYKAILDEVKLKVKLFVVDNLVTEQLIN